MSRSKPSDRLLGGLAAAITVALAACASGPSANSPAGANAGAAASSASAGVASGASASTDNPVQSGTDKAPNPCSLLTAADVQHALGTTSMDIHGQPDAVKQNDFGISWVRQCSLPIGSLKNIDTHFVLVVAERYSGTSNAHLGYKKGADYTGMDATTQPLNGVGDEGNIAFINPSKMGIVTFRKGNDVIAISVVGDSDSGYLNGYAQALTGLAQAAARKLG